MEKTLLFVDQLIKQLINVDDFILDNHFVSSYELKIVHKGQKTKFCQKQLFDQLFLVYNFFFKI